MRSASSPPGDRRATPPLGARVRLVALSGERPWSDETDPEFDARLVKPADVGALAAAFGR